VSNVHINKHSNTTITGRRHQQAQLASTENH